MPNRGQERPTYFVGPLIGGNLILVYSESWKAQGKLSIGSVRQEGVGGLTWKQLCGPGAHLA